jgi:hypothetical protein
VDGDIIISRLSPLNQTSVVGEFRFTVSAVLIVLAALGDAEQVVQIAGDETLFGQQPSLFEFFDVGQIAQGGEAEAR